MWKQPTADFLIAVGIVCLLGSIGINLVTLPTIVYVRKSQGRQGIARLKDAMRQHPRTHPLTRRKSWMVALAVMAAASFLIALGLLTN